MLNSLVNRALGLVHAGQHHGLEGGDAVGQHPQHVWELFTAGHAAELCAGQRVFISH